MGWGSTRPPPGTPLNRSLPFVQSLVGCWPFTEHGGLTAIDATGGPLDGRLTNATDTPFGYNFTSSGFFTAPSHPKYDGNFGTVSFWMQTSQSANFIHLFSRMDSSFLNGFVCFIDSTSSAVRCQCAKSSGSAILDCTGTINVRDGKRHHIALSFDRTLNGKVQIYVDGKLDASGINTAVWSFTGTEVRMGKGLDSFLVSLNGVMDFPLWSSSILTAQDVLRLRDDPYFIFTKPKRKVRGVATAGSTFNPFKQGFFAFT